jgi:hypothetical protein
MQATALKMWKDKTDMNPKIRNVVVWTSLNWFRLYLFIHYMYQIVGGLAVSLHRVEERFFLPCILSVPYQLLTNSYQTTRPNI